MTSPMIDLRDPEAVKREMLDEDASAADTGRHGDRDRNPGRFEGQTGLAVPNRSSRSRKAAFAFIAFTRR